MVFNHTYSNIDRKLRWRNGFTIIEFLIATGIAAVVAGIVAGTMMYSARSLSSINNYISLDRDNRRTIDQLTMDIRQCRGLTNIHYTSGKITGLVFVDYDKTNLEFKFDATDSTFKRIKSGTTLTLLTNCSGEFSIFQRTPKNNAWDHYEATTNTGTCKLVQVKWTAARTAMGVLANTEDVQTAQIVLRN